MLNSTRRPLWPVVSVLMALLGACRGAHAPTSAATVITYTSPTWYEETGRYFQPAPHGRLAIYGSGPRARLYDLSTGNQDAATWHASMEQVRGGAFEPTAVLARLGEVGGQAGWYTELGGQLTRLAVPA